MPDNNPYQPPVKNLEPKQPVGYSEVKALSTSGRVGRMRYIAYSVAYGLMLNIAVALLTAIDIQATGNAATGIIAIGTLIIYVVFLVALVILTIQRVHDFNASGWVSIIMLVPLINFALWFIPGTSTANDYGKPTPPNTIGVYVLALIIPIAIIGILASVAIPAYNEYIQSAQQAAGQ